MENEGSSEVKVAWCEPDSCPVTICGGPHYEHTCGEYEVTGPAGPCPFCGWTLTSANHNPAALTDEELAEFGHDRAGSDGVFCATCGWSWPCLPSRVGAALRASRAEVERLREESREDYARAERAESALMPLRSRMERMSAVADDLAIALHHCSAFLPLFLSEHGEEGRKLARALAVNEQVDVAMKAYCDLTGTRRPALTERTVNTNKEQP